VQNLDSYCTYSFKLTACCRASPSHAGGAVGNTLAGRRAHMFLGLLLQGARTIQHPHVWQFSALAAGARLIAVCSSGASSRCCGHGCGALCCAPPLPAATPPAWGLTESLCSSSIGDSAGAASSKRDSVMPSTTPGPRTPRGSPPATSAEKQRESSVPAAAGTPASSGSQPCDSNGAQQSKSARRRAAEALLAARFCSSCPPVVAAGVAMGSPAAAPSGRRPRLKSTALLGASGGRMFGAALHGTGANGSSLSASRALSSAGADAAAAVGAGGGGGSNAATAKLGPASDGEAAPIPAPATSPQRSPGAVPACDSTCSHPKAHGWCHMPVRLLNGFGTPCHLAVYTLTPYA
jgi:hypothetical protein